MKLAGETLKAGCVPVPLNAIVRGEFEALLVTVTAPVTLPAADGANVAVSVTVCDGFSVAGVVNPVTENPVPVAATLVMFTAALPELVKTMFCGALVPTATVPKLTLAGFADNCPVAVLAEPLRAMLSEESEALLLTVTEPVSLPAVAGLKVTVNVAVCDGFNVAGVVSPLTENPVPVAATLEIFTAALPELVKTTCLVVLLPVLTPPKLMLVGFAVSWPVGVDDPVPLSAIVTVGLLGSLLVTATLPVTLPDVVGENVTVACADCPALMVFGVVIPLIPNSAPLIVMTDTVKSADPALLSVRVALPWSPVDTVPKLIETGLTDICGAAFTPVADRFTTTGELPPSPETVIVPVRPAAEVGVTLTEKLLDCPAPNANGKLAPDALNWVLENVGCAMLTDTDPTFEMVTVWLACLPTFTFPKLMLVIFS